jgi:hypothetical protein
MTVSVDGPDLRHLTKAMWSRGLFQPEDKSRLARLVADSLHWIPCNPGSRVYSKKEPWVFIAKAAVGSRATLERASNECKRVRVDGNGANRNQILR